MTTDWTVDHALEKMIPGYMEWDRKTNRHSQYEATLVGSDPVLFKNTVPTAQWHFDSGCHFMRIKSSKVRVLVESREVAKEDSDSKGVLAAIFAYGNGQVLHLVAHFGTNFGKGLPDLAPDIGISLRQAIAGNFVVNGIETNN